MADPWDGVLARLEEALSRYDREAAARLVYEVSGRLQRGEVLAPDMGARFLGALRRKRCHDLVERLAETFRFAGVASSRIRRLAAQALIDQGKVDAAIDTLEALAAITAAGDPVEHAEAVGLLGRVHKQLYVDAVNADPAAASSAVVQGQLRRSLEAYRSVYAGAPAQHLWHGINAVAVAARAVADGVALEPPFDVARTAAAILAVIEGRRVAGEPVPAWDQATAMECCVALKQAAPAERWLAAYVADPGADAFELHSTLRQLREVWRLSAGTSPGDRLLPILEAQLAQRQGGRVDLAPAEVAFRRQALERGDAGALQGLEKTFGVQGVVTYQWYCQGLERFRWVARLCDTTLAPMGTGFLLRGSDLDPRLGEEPVLLTNAHVVSDDAAVRAAYGSLHPEQVVARFEAWEQGQKAGPREFKVRGVLFSSPPGELDATVMRLDPAPPDGPTFPIAAALPAPSEQPPVYVIGHPLGGGLSIALSDNLLLDLDERRLHYRAPTEPGSSGSPVFDKRWALIALHHAGDANTPRLHGQPGTYAANEGIAFSAIAVAVRAAALPELPPRRVVRRPAAGTPPARPRRRATTPARTARRRR